MNDNIEGKGEYLLKELSRQFTLREIDIKEDAMLSRSGFSFNTSTYEIEDVGHMCIMRMKAMLGLMKMETVVVSSMNRDMPLMNLDWVKVPFKETLIGELYDTQLAPWPEEEQELFREISERDRDIPDYSTGKPHWYDGIRYSCSYGKSGGGVRERLDASARQFCDTFTELLKKAPECDEEAKREGVERFAKTLVEQGGPAVDQVTKLFGPDVARRLILNHMYGV